MTAYLISVFFSGSQWMNYDGPVTIPWKLGGKEGVPGTKYMFVQFRDAAMPGNTATRIVSVSYTP